MKINLKSKIFDLEKTLYSGQTPTFVFKKDNKKHWGYIKEKEFKPIKIHQKNNQLKLKSKASKQKIKTYLGLKDNLKKIYKKINTEKIIDESIRKNKGLRITNSDPIFTILIFLSSQNNSMYNIKNFLQILSKKHGRKIRFCNKKIYLPPKNEKLFNLDKKDFKECKAGYRAEYMEKTFKKIKKEKIDLQELNKETHKEVRKKLKKLPGVGEKVADCISLFAYNNIEAFPVDTHIRKIIKENYNEKLSDKEIREFSRKKWGEYAGYAQQYLYMNKIEVN